MTGGWVTVGKVAIFCAALATVAAWGALAAAALVFLVAAMGANAAPMALVFV